MGDSFIEARVSLFSTLFDHNLRPFTFTFRETTLDWTLGTEPKWPSDATKALRGRIQNRIAENSRRINEEMRAMKTAQRRMGLTLSRISPASMFQLVAIDVSGTGLALQDRYVDSINEYRTRFNSFVEEKGGNRMVMRAGGGHADDDEEDGVGVFGEQGQPLDLREMPRFDPAPLDARTAIAPTITDLGLLGFLAVACFGVSFVAFLRYDVRP